MATHDRSSAGTAPTPPFAALGEATLTWEQSEQVIVRRQIRDTDPDAADECLLCGMQGRPLAADHACQPVLPDADRELGQQSPADLCALLVQRYCQRRGPRHVVPGADNDDRPSSLTELLARPKPRKQVPRTPTSVGGPQAANGKAKARLAGLLRRLQAAPEGTRNAMLHWAACRVGEMVIAGELPNAHGAADALETVALSIGLAPREIEGTIRSGLAASGVNT